jgi:hypothetical protein
MCNTYTIYKDWNGLLYGYQSKSHILQENRFCLNLKLECLLYAAWTPPKTTRGKTTQRNTEN